MLFLFGFEFCFFVLFCFVLGFLFFFVLPYLPKIIELILVSKYKPVLYYIKLLESCVSNLKILKYLFAFLKNR